MLEHTTADVKTAVDPTARMESGAGNEDLTTREAPAGGLCAGISIAQMRHIFNMDEVVERAHKLPSESTALMNMYMRMMDKGSERFEVKPSSLPLMDSLYEDLPNFHEVLDDVRRQLALCVDSGDPLEIAPMLLLGPPGVGKTNFARQLSRLLGTGFAPISMSSLTAGWIISGSSSQWRGARPGKVFEALFEGDYANPVILVDEIDKARTEGAYDPLGSLYSLLEHDTAKAFVDEFTEVPVDASQLIWVATANEGRAIPGPIMQRMTVFEIKMPDAQGARTIIKKLYQQIRDSHAWGQHFEPAPREEVLEHLSKVAPRLVRRAITTGFGNAKLARRDHILRADLPAGEPVRQPMGFTADRGR